MDLQIGSKACSEVTQQPSKLRFTSCNAKYFFVFSKIHKAIGLDATKRLPAGTQIGSAPMNMETYKYFESIDLVLSEIFGCTEASGPQVCNLEGIISPPYS